MARQLVRRNPAVQDEISAAISRMEAMMRAQGKRQPYRPPAPLPVSNSSVSPSRSASTVGPVTSPAPVRPIFGPVDAKGNPIVPRSAYLRSFVAPAASAPPAHTDANDDTISYILNHGRRRTTSPLRSTVLRKLQEDLAECTFQPNAKRIQNQPRQQSSNDLAQSKDDLASNDPPTKSHAYPPVYQRLYKAETHHLSATFAQKWGPHTAPSESKDRSPPQKQRPATAAAAPATATAPPPKKASRPAAASQAKSAPSAAAHDIFKRLYNDGLTKLTEKTRTDTAAKSRQDKRAEACNAKTQQHLAKMAADVQQRERNIQLMRERAIELERRYIEGKRKELLEHVRRHPGTYHHTNAGPPASTLAHSRGAVVVHPKPNRPGAGAAPPPPDNDVHHSTTSSGVDSTMVLTPNGTWTRRPLASSAAPVPPPALEDANNTNNATSVGGGGGDEANSGTTGNSPGRSRPPGISPLLLSKLHKAS